MAIGGMIGGGIFSVLGVTIQLAGHLAFVCFILAGAVALMTARGYAGLTLRAKRSGGPYAYLREAGHPQLAAITSWFLVLGYVIALAVYAFTFGHYVAGVLDLGDLAARIGAIFVLIAFWVVNTRGVGASVATEDGVVLVKLLVLALIAGIGLASWSNHRLAPLASNGYLGVFVGAASVFVAYEGFELLSYDYDDFETPERTLPRALYLSVIAVALVYVVVTLGSQMLVPDRLIVAQREIAFAAVGQKALGGLGRWLATGAAVLATSSAINATLFSTARLVRDLSDARELPEWLGRDTRGAPGHRDVVACAVRRRLRDAADHRVDPRLRFGDVPRGVRPHQPSVRPYGRPARRARARAPRVDRVRRRDRGRVRAARDARPGGAGTHRRLPRIRRGAPARLRPLHTGERRATPARGPAHLTSQVPAPANAAARRGQVGGSAVAAMICSRTE